jgi:type I site-specific restriction endonuclease
MAQLQNLHGGLVNGPRDTGISLSEVLGKRRDAAATLFSDEDEEFARRYDLSLLNLQLVIVDSSPDQARYQQQVGELAGALEEKKAIPSVSQQMELILEIPTDPFWQNVTLPTLKQVENEARTGAPAVPPRV